LRKKPLLSVVLILSLTVLFGFPTISPRVHAFASNGTNYWSAYGPWMDNLVYKVYSDFGPMFTDFVSGQLDITDWAIQPGDLANIRNNPDFWVSTIQREFGIFQMDINHQNPLFNVASPFDSWQAPRTLGTPALSLVSSSACVGCPANTFQLIIQLQNLEEGNTAILDLSNLVTATITGTSSAVVAKADDGGASPTGTYSLGFLSDAAGIPSYVLTTSVYSGSVTLPASGAGSCAANTSCTFALRVNYNSGSTVKPSSSGIYMFRALSHLVDKPNYLKGPYLTALGVTFAECVDVFAPPAQGLMKSVATIVDNCNASSHESSVTLATLTAECATLAVLDPTGWGTGGPLACSSTVNIPPSLYNLHSDVVTAASSCAAGTVGISCFESANPSPVNVGTITGYSGLVDLRAACDYLVAAGFTVTPAGSTCQNVAGCGNNACTTSVARTAHIANPAGSCNAATGVGCIIMYIRRTPQLTAYGQIFADELNDLLGTPAPSGGTVCYGGPPSLSCSFAPLYFNIGQVGGIVFSVAVVADWNLYTGGFSLGTTPDQLYSLHTSQFASNLCGGTASTLPNNYVLYCDPAYDTQAQAGEFASDVSVTVTAFQAAATIGATRGDVIPVYAGVNGYSALNSWSRQDCGTPSPGGTHPIIGPCSVTDASLVSVLGHGFESGSGDLLNMRPAPGYVPSNPLFYASGCNPAAGCEQNLIRRSIAQPTRNMTPWTFTTTWDAEPLTQIYDRLLFVDPNSGGLCQPAGTAHCLDWMTGGQGGSVIGHKIVTNSPIIGQTTVDFSLRSDLYFHDGVPVTPHDVCFSILSYRDAPSASFLPSVSNVVSCQVALPCSVICSTGANDAIVVVNGVSPFTELNLGRVFIVPEHVWAPLCGGVVAPNSNTANADACKGTTVVTPACSTPPCPGATALASRNFDPVAAGDMVGSGPWVCNPSVGVSTISRQASCTQLSTGVAGGQALGPGGRILLTRNLQYVRCCPNVQTAEKLPNGFLSRTTNLQALEWADFNKNGKVDVNDFATAFPYYGQGCTTSSGPVACYFANPLYSSGAATGCNSGFSPPCFDLISVATIGQYFDYGLTRPFTGTSTGPFTASPPSELTQYDPNVDPFVVTSGSTVLGYYQACQRVTGGISCRIVSAGTFTNTATLKGPLPGGVTSTASPAGSTGITFTFTGTFSPGLYKFSITGTTLEMTVNL
jgi:ABC-type transport system substrate-binding protein